MAAYLGRRAGTDVVDDLVDEVFLVVWRRLDCVPEEPRPWLLAVARNVLGTHIRGARRSRALSVKLAAVQVDSSQPAPTTIDGAVVRALAALKPTDREALMLVNWEGMTPIEAARSLGQSPAAFRVRLYRARARLRRLLAPVDEAPDGQAEGSNPTREQHIDLIEEAANA